MLQILSSEDTVLDLGCGPSSPVASLDVKLNIGIDIDPLSRRVNNERPLVQADAERLPFRDDSFSFVVSNHSMEHIPNLDKCLREVKRVMTSDGTLYIAVPLSVTLSDRLYRFIYSGGGHVQAFRSVDDVVGRITSIVGLPCIGYSRIQSGFHFLTSPDVQRLGRRKRWLIGWMHPEITSIGVFILSILDRMFRTESLLYGYSFYFSANHQVTEPYGPTHTCCRCGGVHSVGWLKHIEVYRQWLGCMVTFRCPACDQLNMLIE